MVTLRMSCARIGKKNGTRKLRNTVKAQSRRMKNKRKKSKNIFVKVFDKIKNMFNLRGGK